MLILGRRKGEKIIIADNISLQIVDYDHNMFIWVFKRPSLSSFIAWKSMKKSKRKR
jgi:hypothetical protein